MKLYTVVWNDYEAGIEVFNFLNKNIAIDFAIDAVVTTYEEDCEYREDEWHIFNASIKNRFEMFIVENET